MFKSKPIQIKTANRSKKIENHTKSNIIECVWMIFCENCLEWIGFWIDFSKPNRTEPHTNILIYISIFTIRIYYIILSYYFFLFNSFNTMYDFNLINFVSFVCFKDNQSLLFRTIIFFINHMQYFVSNLSFYNIFIRLLLIKKSYNL